jgi:hypothetical protein
MQQKGGNEFDASAEVDSATPMFAYDQPMRN